LEGGSRDLDLALLPGTGIALIRLFPVVGADRLRKALFLASLLGFAILSPVHVPALPPQVRDLPLLEFPAAARNGLLAVFLSGDGGWADLDRQISGRLVAAGLPVIGWNCQKYFWTARTPEQAARDLERTLQAYLTAWNKSQAVLIGYSDRILTELSL
jgi:type IV secretory pathway VirJ component